jgi:uncharacterized protein
MLKTTMDTMDLNKPAAMMKKTAVITGASGGIGLELAKLIAADGYRLVLLARNSDKLRQIAADLSQEYTIEVEIFPVDLSQPAECNRFIAFAETHLAHVEILINNAGFGDYDLFADCSAERVNEMILLNIHSLTILSRHFLPGMIQQNKGYIMNVASVAAFMPGPYMSVYYATKAYVLSLSQAIAEEVKDKGIKVSALCPGPTHTGFVDAANLNDSNLFKLMKPASARAVAVYGYKAMLRGQRVAVHGFSNKMMVWAVRFMPRNWVSAAVKTISKKA